MTKISTIKRIYAKKEYTVIELIITYKCQLNCNFCFIKHNNILINDQKLYNKINLDLDQTLIFIKKFHEITKRDIHLKILGGEPTLHTGLFNFLQNLKNLDYIKNIVVFSNLMSSIETYIKILSIGNVEFDLSYHMTNTHKFNKKFFINLTHILKYCQNNNKKYV